MSHVTRQNKKFDLIIWGSTGYTGKLVCDYISKNYKRTNLKWALGGRNELKIKSLISSLNLKNIPYLIADSSNKNSLLKMTKTSPPKPRIEPRSPG